jgi:hypothetical protein
VKPVQGRVGRVSAFHVAWWPAKDGFVQVEQGWSSWFACIKEFSQQLEGEVGQSGPRINDRQCSTREAEKSMGIAVWRHNQAGSMIP